MALGFFHGSFLCQGKTLYLKTQALIKGKMRASGGPSGVRRALTKKSAENFFLSRRTRRSQLGLCLARGGPARGSATDEKRLDVRPKMPNNMAGVWMTAIEEHGKNTPD
jgi:hypothetical protein